MRVLITGMGGELGTRVAALIEADSTIEDVHGVDIDPPRRRLTRAEFHRIDPRDRIRLAEVVHEVAPTTVIHLGIFEPNARSGPRRATAYTAAGTVGLFGALAAEGSVERIVVRSGTEVYGRRRGGPLCPDEESVTDPTTPYGHSLRHVERVALDFAEAHDVPVSLLRFAPLVGPHFPSPLGRLLRLPFVPHAAGDPPFSVLHQEDAAASVVAALGTEATGPCNVVAPGAVTASQAARLGARLPLLTLPPAWRAVRLAVELAGAPMPEHVAELLRRGRTADGTRSSTELGFEPAHTTHDVVEQLYEWSDVTYLTAMGTAA
ncbi:MAG: NAD-dependent epimerase/dehydratase family protein [Acidimicrobiia bacterium]|nr:NAD-dependent epimerase/dehydratase family protein [Acidimicrobiia bacterium]MCC5954375.1 NAD-dependent epimerase/dehydratase family protein [Acidimicrobiia bacterium]